MPSPAQGPNRICHRLRACRFAPSRFWVSAIYPPSPIWVAPADGRNGARANLIRPTKDAVFNGRQHTCLTWRPLSSARPPAFFRPPWSYPPISRNLPLVSQARPISPRARLIGRLAKGECYIWPSCLEYAWRADDLIGPRSWEHRLGHGRIETQIIGLVTDKGWQLTSAYSSTPQPATVPQSVASCSAPRSDRAKIV
jgi:hypothetical protein